MVNGQTMMGVVVHSILTAYTENHQLRRSSDR